MNSTLATNADLRGPAPEALLAASFLARYREPTRTHYGLCVKQWFQWCREKGLAPMDAQRVHIEVWMREMEEVQGLMLSTISGKLTAIKQFYNFAVMDNYLVANPVQWVKRPSVPRHSTTNGLTRTELFRIVDAAKESGVQDEAIMCILGYNGLRVGELVAIQVEDIGMFNGYHTVKIVREKSMEAATIPLAPRTSWAVQRQMYGRTSGPLFMLRGEVPMDRRGVDRIVKRPSDRPRVRDAEDALFLVLLVGGEIAR